ncbi:MAG: prepilin-type N-terminal cleavage/methylation domain-containing protein [Nitrospirae bacterium]|nr:prepilin-type N-terminal cleavage/methylation domain-containing protein [Nitrospirota bacterium]
MKKLLKNEKGFTLIELAIVLVIIGIIIGAVMKGQDLIENARHKKLANTVKQFEVLAWGFLDRKGYFPGDDSPRDGLIEGNVSTALISSGRFLDPPTTNSIILGSFTFYVWLGNSGTRNIIAVTNTDGATAAVLGNEELAYMEAFDTSIDGTANGNGGRVRATTTAMTLNSGSWLVTGTPASATWDTANVRALIYYFDRNP